MYLTKQSLTLLTAQCRWVNAACSYTRGPRPPSQTPNSSLNMINITFRLVRQWAPHCSTALTLGLYFFKTKHRMMRRNVFLLITLPRWNSAPSY